MQPRRELKSYVRSSLSVIVLSLVGLYGVSCVLVPIVRKMSGAEFDWTTPFTIVGTHKINGEVSWGLMLVRLLVLLGEAYGMAVVIIEPLRKLDFIGSCLFLEMVISLLFLSPPGWGLFGLLVLEVGACWGMSLALGIVHDRFMDKRLMFKRME